MSISLKVERKFKNLTPEFINSAKKKFYREVAAQLPDLLKESYRKGISPTEGVGKFKQYSKSYVEQIAGKLTFRVINGKVIPIKLKKTVTKLRQGKEIGQNSRISYDKETGAIKRGKDQAAHSKLKWTKVYDAGLGFNKLKSPVNLRVSGKMIESLKAIVSSNSVTIQFDSEIAKYHNGYGKVDRQILPKGNQSFSSLIMKKLRDLLRESLKT
jgi:hypothetical protein